MTYSQSTGILTDKAGLPFAFMFYVKAKLPYPPGHAGNGGGINNRSLQYEHNIGPLCGADENGNGGKYKIGAWCTHGTLGPISAPLTPLADASGSFAWLKGRGGFYIHGPEFSEGCVVQEEPIREAASLSGDTELEVIP